MALKTEPLRLFVWSHPHDNNPCVDVSQGFIHVAGHPDPLVNVAASFGEIWGGVPQTVPLIPTFGPTTQQLPVGCREIGGQEICREISGDIALPGGGSADGQYTVIVWWIYEGDNVFRVTTRQFRDAAVSPSCQSSSSSSSSPGAGPPSSSSSSSS